MGYELKTEVGTAQLRVHAIRLRRIPEGVVETGDSVDGIFPDGLWTFKRIAGTERRNKRTGQMERHFRVRSSGSTSSS